MALPAAQGVSRAASVASPTTHPNDTPQHGKTLVPVNPEAVRAVAIH